MEVSGVECKILGFRDLTSAANRQAWSCGDALASAFWLVVWGLWFRAQGLGFRVQGLGQPYTNPKYLVVQYPLGN